MKIESVELSIEEFAPYGEVMAGADAGGFNQLGEGDDYTWTQTAGGVEMDPICCSGMLLCKNREMVVRKMEYHAKTSEILVALKNDYVLCVATPGEEVDMKTVKAFRVKQGTVLVMKRACWHWIPFPAGKSNAEILVIFRGKTGEDDLIYSDLPEDVVIDK